MVSKFDTIIFDLDSTLVTIEGLEWLAEQERKTTLPLISAALEGKVPLATAFEKEMTVIAPQYKDMLALGRKYQESLIEDASEVIDALQTLGKEVWLVTNNFHPAIDIIANSLNIPLSHVFGSTLYFGNTGGYLGFDAKSPLVRNGGKAEVIRSNIPASKKVVFIGDGIPDLEVKPVVDLFVGYGGVVTRPVVKKQSHVFLESPNLTPLLSILLEDDELSLLKKHHSSPSAIKEFKLH